MPGSEEARIIAQLQKRIKRLESAQADLEKTKQQLDAERTFSESIIASLPGLFFLIDEQGRYLRWNKNLETLLGFTADEIMLRDCRDFVPEADKDRVFGAVGTALRDGHFTLEYKNKTKYGREIPFFAQGVSVKLRNQSYVMGVEMDLSEQKRAEEALRQSEEHLRSLMETATNFVVYRLAFDGGDPDSGRVVFVSPSITDLMGIDEPLDLRNWFVNVHPEDRERIRDDHFRLPRPERTRESMRVVNPQTGEMRWIQFLSTTILGRDGTLEFSNGIIFDVTDRVQALEALRQSEEKMQRQADKMAKMNTALQVLVEHREEEIKNIESGILTTLERLVIPYLEEIDQARLSPDQRVYLEIIKSNLNKITSPLTRKLTEWQSKLSPAEIKVADLVRNGKSTKELSQLLGTSENAVSFHRKNIRAKLGLAGRKVNLATFLQSQER